MNEDSLDPEGLQRLASAVEGNERDAEAPGYVWDPPEEPESSNPLSVFPKEVQQDIEGLMWLGYLEDSFEFCSHHFVIRTLRGDEELIAAAVSKQYFETVGQAKAWAWANVSLALVSVDHDPGFCPPIGPDKTAYGHARFDYATSKWFWPLGDYLFRRYVELVGRQEAAFKAIQDLS